MVEIKTIEEAMKIIEADADCHDEKVKSCNGCYLDTLTRTGSKDCLALIAKAERIIVNAYKAKHK